MRIPLNKPFTWLVGSSQIPAIIQPDNANEQNNMFNTVMAIYQL